MKTFRVLVSRQPFDEVTIEADDWDLEGETLVFVAWDNTPIAAFAPGAWLFVRIEEQENPTASSALQK